MTTLVEFLADAFLCPVGTNIYVVAFLAVLALGAARVAPRLQLRSPAAPGPFRLCWRRHRPRWPATAGGSSAADIGSARSPTTVAATSVAATVSAASVASTSSPSRILTSFGLPVRIRSSVRMCACAQDFRRMDER